MEIIMSLVVSSETVSSEQMAATLGITPDRAWNIGDFRPKTRCKEKNNGIIIDSGIERKGSVEEHIEAICKKIKPLRVNLVGLSKECETTLSIVYYSTYCNPGLWLSKSFITFLASIKAGVDMDGYVL
jgi:hypothetical protein